MAARNLAVSLLHDIISAGRGRAAPSTGGEEAGPDCSISLIRAAAEPLIRATPAQTSPGMGWGGTMLQGSSWTQK